MNRRSFLILAIFICAVLILIWMPIERGMGQTYVIRAAMDIGSGSTNLKVAEIDSHTNKIISIIFEHSIPVAYQKHLEKSENNTFDNEVMTQGIAAIKQLKSEADRFEVKKIVAVATAAFRQAANAQQFVGEIKNQTGINVRIINQDEEGILAFRGALAVTTLKPEQTVVWDIGGGSMQMTTLTNEGTYYVEKGKTASIPFKNTIIMEIQQKDIKTVHSPNPITPSEMQSALQYAAQAADESSSFIKSKISEPQTHVVAVGNLFNYGIVPIVNNQRTVKEDQLEKGVMALANKTDKEVPGNIPEVAVSNPLLVLGYMQSLHINQVQVVSINNADGALTNPPYWDR